MRIPYLRWSLASLPFLLFVLAAWILENVLGLQGNVRWILRVGLWALGLVASFLTHRLLASRTEEDGAGDRDRTEEIDAAVSAAEKRLSRAASVPADRVRRLPAILLLGPRGSTKTTVVAHGGLEPELLAGEVWRGESIAPTDGVNLWYGEGTVLAEAGGSLLDDPDRWERLLRRLRPSRLDAVLGRRDQPHRAAVVCFGCDEFVKPGASETVPAAARRLREHLQGAARRLGVRLPVYVLFTKADRIPYFEDYVRNLSRSEARQVLGATIPLGGWSAPGTYAERAPTVLGTAFEEVFEGLARGRAEQLRREGDPEAKRGIYEFPRELHRISETATRFMVELCRPSHLQVSPVFRGFYFTGVRPVVVEGSEPPPASSAPDPGAGTADMGATMVFDASRLQSEPSTPQEGDGSGAGSRRVPEWTFLARFFRNVLLGDEAARTMTGSGASVHTLRRVLGGAFSAVLLCLVVALTVSTVSNRRLVAGVTGALEEAGTLVEAPAASPGLGELRALDSLGSRVSTLRSWEEEDPPLRARWGLYRGSDLLEPARRAYLRVFERVLGQEARQALAARLAALPDEPDESSDYSATYDALKAYLMTTSFPEHATGEFLAPVLVEHWSEGRSLESEALELARRQFAIYGEELRHGRPGAAPSDAALVNRTREFLDRFASVERYYRSMITRASEETPGLELSDRFPSARGVLAAEVAVPGAFTQEGWRFIQENLNDVDRLFAREEWVTGGQTFSEADLEQMAGELRSRYLEDYRSHWQELLRSTSVAAFRDADDAAGKLRTLSDNRSPLLQLLTAVDRNTRLGVPEIDEAFQPVRLVTPPDTIDRYVVEENEAYVDALADLQSSVEQLGRGGGGPSRVEDDADRVRGVVRELARDFSIGGEVERTGTALRELLEAPADRSVRLAGELPARELNAAGAEFCRRFDSLARGYPFDAGASQDAAIDDVDAALQPGESALWSFYDETLQDRVGRQGGRWAARSGASPAPGSRFLDFFNRAARVSDALYADDGSGPAVDFILRLEASERIPEVTASIDGQEQSFTRTFAAGQPFRWEADRARTARITGRIDGQETTLLEAPEGPWALFRLLGRARWESRGDGVHELTWPVPGRQVDLRGRLILDVPVPILNPDFLAGLTCVPTVTR